MLSADNLSNHPVRMLVFTDVFELHIHREEFELPGSQ